MLCEIPVDLIDPSPYQTRQKFDAKALQRLADDIAINGLLNPVLCRQIGERYELLHGERRLRAVRLIPWTTISAQIREATDLEARRICAAENVHRMDLTPVEIIEATIQWVDAYLYDCGDYQLLGETPHKRLSYLLTKLWSDKRNETNFFTYKFISKVVEAFEATNQGVGWESFYNNDMRPYLKLDEEVKDVAIEKGLNKSQTKALQELKDGAPEEFERVKDHGTVEVGVFLKEEVLVEEASARELKGVATRARLERERETRISNILDPSRMPSGPAGGYRAIVIDPPWPMQKIIRNVRPNQNTFDYPTMELDEIAKLPIASLAGRNNNIDPEIGCHIYLWVTQRFLPAGLSLFRQWGIEYECLLTWVKPTGMTPYSWMYNTEHVLFGRIGNLSLSRLGLKLSFEASATGHSKKPNEFYELVRRASPEPRIELFARQERKGFDVWGNEV